MNPAYQPTAEAVDIPFGFAATSSASWTVVAIDQPRPSSAISAVSAGAPGANGSSANASTDSAPPASRSRFARATV